MVLHVLNTVCVQYVRGLMIRVGVNSEVKSNSIPIFISNVTNSKTMKRIGIGISVYFLNGMEFTPTLLMILFYCGSLTCSLLVLRPKVTNIQLLTNSP